MKNAGKNFTVGQVKAALEAIQPTISTPQIAMLRAHYRHRILSMQKSPYWAAIRSTGQAISSTALYAGVSLTSWDLFIPVRLTRLLQVGRMIPKVIFNGEWMMPWSRP